MSTPPPSKPSQPAANQPEPQKPAAVPAVVATAKPTEVAESKPAAPPAKKPPPAAAPKPPPPVKPTAPKGKLRPRHYNALFSFLFLVVLPIVVSAWYLWGRAADQYASTVGFTVRSEEAASGLNSLLGPLQLGGGKTPDAEIIYNFIQSQDLVVRLDQELDLRAIWSKPGYKIDPVFAYNSDGTIEDLRNYWQRMVKISHDGGTGLMELRVLSFDSNDSQRIALAIGEQSTHLINALSTQAREDTIRYTRTELENAVVRLKQARKALTEFRNRTQIVDPSIDVQGQAGLLSQLNLQLAEALIELDLLRETTREVDPRVTQAERRIKVIEARIKQEKQKLGIGENQANDEAFATLVGEYETLVVDREFAEQTYTASLTAFDAAKAEARRQSRYLAIHLKPTLAERAEYPKRVTLLALIAVFAFLIWSVLLLVVYSLRDRR